MPLGDVCVHLATPVSTTTSEDEDTWIEGEPDEVRKAGAPFECFFMDPGSKEQPNPRGKRKIDQPTILCEGEREDGSPIELTAEDEVIIFAEEIPSATGTVTVASEEFPGALFQVDGDPMPFAPPGELIGWEVRLKKVVD